MRRTLLDSIGVVLAVVLGFGGWAAAQDAAQPPPRRSLQQIHQEQAELQPELIEVFNPMEELADPAKRAELAPRAIPLLKRVMELHEEEAEHNPAIAARRMELLSQSLAFRSLFGDHEAEAQIKQMLADADAAEAVQIRFGILHARWVKTAADAAEQSHVADEAEALVKTHPAEPAAGNFVMFIMHAPAAAPELRERVGAMAGHVEGPTGEWLRKQMNLDEVEDPELGRPDGPLQQIEREIREVQMKFSGLIATSEWADPDKRAEVAPDVIPLLERLVELTEQRAAHWPEEIAKDMLVSRSRWIAIQWLFGDPDADQRLQKMLAEADDRDSGHIGAYMLEMQWLAAAGDADAQAQVAEEVEAFVRARPADGTYLMEQLVNMPAATPGLKQRMRALVDELEGPRAERLRQHLEQREEIPGEP